jgi:hypothetical protein
MTGDSTTVLGIEIPSTDPAFIAVIVGIHMRVVAGAVAMLSEKRRGRHSTAGRSITGACWPSSHRHLFILGALSCASAWLGRRSLRERWLSWARLHITGMDLSYVLILIAFYVDNENSCRFGKTFLPSPIGCCPLLSDCRSSSAHCCGIRSHAVRRVTNSRPWLAPNRRSTRWPKGSPSYGHPAICSSLPMNPVPSRTAGTLRRSQASRPRLRPAASSANISMTIARNT